MLMLLCTVTAWAIEPGVNITDLASLEDGDYVLIYNVGRKKYAYEKPADGHIGNGDNPANLSYIWQVHEEEGGKYSFSSIAGYYIPTPIDGKAMYTVEAADEKKDEFTLTAHPEDNTKWLVQSTNANIYWDGQGAQFVGWQGNGENSRFEIIPVTFTDEELNAYLTELSTFYTEAFATAKDAAKAELDLLATASHLYPVATTDSKAEIDAIELVEKTRIATDAAVAAVNTIVANYKANAYKALSGKYFSIYSPTRNTYFMMNDVEVNGETSLANPNDIWQFIENGGKVNIYNPYKGLYLVEPSNNNSVEIGVTSNVESAGAYELLVSSPDSDEDGAVLKLTSNGKSVHMDGSNILVRWNNGGASEFNVVELTNDEINSIANLHKAKIIANAEGLAIACSDEQIAAVKDAVNAVSTTGFAAFAAIDAAYIEATANLGIGNKVFTFRATSTDSGRNLVWAAAGTGNNAIGADDYSVGALWQAIPAGTGFYLKNITKGYMGLPRKNCPLTAEPSVLYTFELVDAANKVFELHASNVGTLHASTNADNRLMDYDYDDVASRWTVAVVGFAKEWKQTDVWGSAISVAEYPAVAVNEGANGKPVNVREFEVTSDGAKVIDITFVYNSGNCALNVLGVEVVNASGDVVAGDYKSGKTGTGTTCSYQVKVAEAGTYTLRYYVWSDKDNRLNATNGTIAVLIDGVETTEFTHDVTFAAEYATMYLGYRAAIPAGVEAYVVESAEDGWIDLVKVESVLPANTAVVLKKVGEGNEYTFNYTDAAEAEVANNLLDGTIADKYVAPGEGNTAYVLSKPADSEIGFYTATLNQVENTAFKNNANKAYLVVEGAELAAYSFRFPGTTGIEEVTTENGNVKAIYDLTGRRVEAITAPGIYIVNGKKTLVK